jgi:hypothetical protein
MKNQPSTTLFWALAAGTLLGTAVLLADLWPAALTAARHQSVQLTEEGSRTAGGETEVDYRLATWLDPSNAVAFAGLARVQIAAGRADDALVSLERAGQGSEVVRLKVRALLELGRYNEAADVAAQLISPGHTTDDIVLAALAYALAGRSADINALMPLVASPEALQHVQRARAGQAPLAAELYATGLLQSSSTLLSKQPASFERNLLLARIRYTRHSNQDLAQAANFLAEATHLNPSNLEARQLLVTIYRDQGKADEANRQEALISQLQTGRP